MVKYVTFWFLLINYVPEHTAVNQLLFSELYSWVDYSVVSLAPVSYTHLDVYKRQLVFNEVNTIPGFTSHSRYPNMMKGIGWSFERVVNTLAGLAAEP